MTKTPVALTESKVTAEFIRRRFHKGSFLLPNYTPAGWFECDVFELTRSGYFNEYEVKLTRADFLADRMKARRVHINFDGGQVVQTGGEKKHDLIGRPFGPCRFCYITPPEIIQFGELPEWAGHILIKQWGDGMAFEYEVKPPQLHSEKLHADIKQHALGVCYFRYHAAIRRLRITERGEDAAKTTQEEHAAAVS